MIKLSLLAYRLHFHRPAITSRSIMKTRTSWFLLLDTESGKRGIGECAPLEGLSKEYDDTFEEKIQAFVDEINLSQDLDPKYYLHFPSFRFALETAIASAQAESPQVFFPGNFTKGKEGIRINGLIWMGTYQSMKEQITSKLNQGFSCLKLKIGAIRWQDELDLLQSIRRDFPPNRLELRLDANGAFAEEDAEIKLREAERFGIHSIEQPIEVGNREAMYRLCRKAIIPIALDEELLTCYQLEEKKQVLDDIQPQYIILKPGLIGGFDSSQEWISEADKRFIPWWITSALESNLGLNAIAQFSSNFNNKLPQGLGTGMLYSNNFSSPLEIEGEYLYYRPDKNWDIDALLKI